MARINILLAASICLASTMHAQSIKQENIDGKIESYIEKTAQEKIYVHTDKPYYAVGDTIWMRAYLVDAFSNKPTTDSKYVFVEVHDNENPNNNPVSRIMIKQDSLGIFSNAIVLPDKLASGKYSLVAYTQWMRNFSTDNFFYKTIDIVDKQAEGKAVKQLRKISVAALPEGGNLIEGQDQRIAIKVIGNDGHAVDAEIRLVDDKGKILCTTSTIHAGLSYVYLKPESNRKYYVEAYTANNISDRVEIQKPETTGATLQVAQKKDNILIRAITSSDIDASKLKCIIYGSGNHLSIEKLDPNCSYINTADLKPGVVNVALIDKETEKVWSERLIFIRDQQTPKINLSKNIDTRQGKRTSRTPIKLDFNTSSNLAGYYSVSVVDKELVLGDSLQPNIEASLLLNSELRGTIDDPNYYFKDINKEKDMHLDLLMLTQGWRRYNIEELQKEVHEMKYEKQTSLKISGSITGIFGQSMKQPYLNIFAPSAKFMERVQLPTKAKRFCIEDIEYADTTRFYFSVSRKNGKFSHIGVDIDKETYPTIPLSESWQVDQRDYQAFTKQSNLQLTATRLANGEILLPEVVTTARKFMLPAERTATAFSDETLIKGDQMLSSPTMRDVLYNMGFYISRDVEGYHIFNRRRSLLSSFLSQPADVDGVVVYINNGYSDADELLDIDPKQITSLSYYKPENFSLMRNSGQNEWLRGALMVFVDPHYIRKQSAATEVVVLQGIAKPKEFYSPKYEADDPISTSIDRRTTIFWTPCMEINHSGKASLNFYGSDISKNYSVIVEGISNKGKIVHQEYEF